MSVQQPQQQPSWSLWSIIVPLLPLALAFISNIFGRARDQQLIQSGIDQEIAAQAKALLDQTAFGKQLDEKIKAKHDDELDKLLADLGKP